MAMKAQITIMEAKDLEDVGRIGDMKPYAKVSVSSDPKRVKRTPVDKHRKTNPSWFYVMSFTVADGSVLVIKLYSRRKFRKDVYIGEVHKSIKELFEKSSPKEGIQRSVEVTSPVNSGSGESRGQLRFSCRFGDAALEPPSSSCWFPFLQCFTGAAGAAGAAIGIADDIPEHPQF